MISELQTSCEWTGELGELDRYLDLNSELGKQLGDCTFAAVGCLYSLACEYFQHRHVHTYKFCPQHPLCCDYILDYRSVYEDVANNLSCPQTHFVKIPKGV